MELIEKRDANGTAKVYLLIPRTQGITYGRESELNCVPFIYNSEHN
jgi:hypothetical protein